MGIERNHNLEPISLWEENFKKYICAHQKKTKYEESKPMKN
jgi:hypothetical protein